MNARQRMVTIAAIAVLIAGWIAIPTAVQARMEFGDLEVSGELFNYTEVRWGGKQGPNTFSLAVAPNTFVGPAALGAPSNADKFTNINASRTELLLEFVYRGFPHLTPVLKLRPYYDTMFSLNGKSHDIAEDWQTNLHSGLNDKWDPLIREAFVDINFDNLFVRAGRQIVTWGRSDGVTVLDVVTPRNFRNPLTFEQERFMIPQWMVNAKYDLTNVSPLPGHIQQEIQLIWNIEYLPARFPGFRPQGEGQHPWTLNVVDFADQVINVSKGLFAEPNFFDKNRWDEGGTLDKSELFVRWRGRTSTGLGPFSDMTYSLHYAYLFEDIPFYELQGRFDAGFAINIANARAAGGGIDFERHRYQLAGASFDKALMFLPGQFQGTVLRGELAYGIGNQFYEPDLRLVEANNITALIGLDQYLYIGPKSWVKTPWFVSFQVWHDRILRTAGRGAFTNIGSVPCDAQPGCGSRGYIIGGASNVFTGLRDEDRTVLTLFMFNDFLPGKTLHTEFFALHEVGSRQKATWLRGVVGYSFNSSVSARLGANFIWGEDQSFFGQFRKNDSVFGELKYTF